VYPLYEGLSYGEADGNGPREEVMLAALEVKPEAEEVFVENGARPQAANKVAAKSKPGRKPASVTGVAKAGSRHGGDEVFEALRQALF